MAHETINIPNGKHIKSWTVGVSFEEKAREQVANVARMPFIHSHVAIMPDVHWGLGATVGSVIPTKGAIIPAAVGVDIGCGMMAVQTSMLAHELPDNLAPLRSAIEAAVPHGRTHNGAAGDRGAWGKPPVEVAAVWKDLQTTFAKVCEKHPKIAKANTVGHLGTLGTGNHFIEVCLDEDDRVWLMLHSGSRGIGNRIGSYFIERAKKEMQRHFINLPDKNLAYLAEGTDGFDDYVEAVGWAQEFARWNRQLMMQAVVEALRGSNLLPEFEGYVKAVNCHHNYVAKERHFGADVWLTRKGAVRAREGDLGIIPGSMGTIAVAASASG